MSIPICTTGNAVCAPREGDNNPAHTEATTGGFFRTGSNYSKESYKAQIVSGGGVTKTNPLQLSFPDRPRETGTKEDLTPVSPGEDCPDRCLGLAKFHSTQNAPETATNEGGNAVITQQPGLSHGYKPVPAIKPKAKQQPVIQEYTKANYTVLLGDRVKVCLTAPFASLPVTNAYMVKERRQDSNGVTTPKYYIRHSEAAREKTQPPVNRTADNGDCDDVSDTQDKEYLRRNAKTPGRIYFTQDKRFNGRGEYDVPGNKQTTERIGSGGNGFVFVMYHGKKRYAVKKTVLRAAEVNVQTALSHNNILALNAVLMGERHERHPERFYCFHFMPRMDYDLRKILSDKKTGCLKSYHLANARDPAKFARGFKNVMHFLNETREGIAYMHSKGFVHRDIKAGNIMIKMQCRHKHTPLTCDCGNFSGFKVKLGDFDSSGIVPGSDIKDPAGQIIKSATILPLGTPGYRAPEVSMHINLSGPCELLYTTAVDMWSFGSLLLNVCIGKTAALRQREQASLLLSLTHGRGEELWEKTTKINKLEKTRPFSDNPELIGLIRGCLQTDPARRPSAKDAKPMMENVIKKTEV